MQVAQHLYNRTGWKKPVKNSHNHIAFSANFDAWVNYVPPTYHAIFVMKYIHYLLLYLNSDVIRDTVSSLHPKLSCYDFFLYL